MGIMVTGREHSLKKVVEYLVSIELCRRGLISTSFNENISDFDVLAIDNWLSDEEYLWIILKTDEKPNIEQEIANFEERLKQIPDEELILSYANLASSGKDDVTILKPQDILRIIEEIKRGGRPDKIKRIKLREPEPTHTAINSDGSSDHRNN